MAKKAIRIYRNHTPDGRASVRSRPKPVPVYSGGNDVDRNSITQQVIAYPEARVERMRAAKDDRYEALLHSIYEFTFITTLDGVIRDLNSRAEQGFLMDRGTLRGTSIIQLISGADEHLLEILGENVDEQRFTILEAVCLRGDGSRFNAELTVNRLHAGGKDSLVFFVRDTTSRLEAEKDLHDANERALEAEKLQVRVDTIATLLHELNNPLQIISCKAELDGDTDYSDQVHQIMGVLQRLGAQQSLDTLVDESGATRYKMGQEELKPCDGNRILVVDNEPALKEMFTQALAKAFPEHQVESANHGKEAVEMFSQGRHALIITDVAMPVMDGEAAYREIHALCEHEGWHVPRFVFCTGFIVSDSLREIIGDGSKHCHVRKPLSLRDLVDVTAARVQHKHA